MYSNCVGGYYKIIGELYMILVLFILANIIWIEINIAFGKFDIVVMNLFFILLCVSGIMSD